MRLDWFTAEQHRDGTAGDRGDRSRTRRAGRQPAHAVGLRHAAARRHRGRPVAGVLAAGCRRAWVVCHCCWAHCGHRPDWPARRSCCRRSQYALTERIIEFARTQQALRAARRVEPARSMVGDALAAQHGATMRLLTMQVPGQLLFSLASQLALILFAGATTALTVTQR